MRSNTDWFSQAGWGVFVHYLAAPASSPTAAELTVEEWNHRIDGFDVQGLADQLAAVGAGYFFITLGQNSGFFLSPNETYDSFVKRSPSRLSHRDLVAELVDALVPRGIRVMVYLPSHAPAMDRQAVEGLQCTPRWDASCWQLRPGSYLAYEGVDDRLSGFQRNWEAVIREWSCRWGKGVSGWWFDGCYLADRMYRSPDEPNFRSFAAAVKAGNPESLVAFNPGVKVPVICYTEYEDYTAGEVADTLPVLMDSHWGRPEKPKQYWGKPMERFVNGAQYHLLTFLGYYWGRGEPRFADEMVAGYTKHVNSFGGVISWDVPTSEQGLIPDAFVRQLGKLRQT